MKTRGLRTGLVLAVVLTMHAGAARAQYGYPAGYGGYGWGGWGGGATAQGDMARGMGVYAAGAGVYNERTAVANSINANTVMNWNQYMYDSALTSARVERARQAKRLYGTVQAQDKLYKRLRDEPDARDVSQGDALNVAMEEINNPKVYSKALAGAKATIGGETIRDIPFQYAAGAITTSIHQVTQQPPPQALMRAEFADDRAALKTFGQEIRKSLDEGNAPDRKTVDRAIAVVDHAEANAATMFERNSPNRVASDKYLKSIRGLLVMMETPSVHLLTAGVENRPDATLGELLNFMNAFNLRFGPATTPRQREVYQGLYPKLSALRDQVAPVLATEPPARATASATASTGKEAGEFFSGMDYADIKKKTPPPPVPAKP